MAKFSLLIAFLLALFVHAIPMFFVGHESKGESASVFVEFRNGAIPRENKIKKSARGNETQTAVPSEIPSAIQNSEGENSNNSVETDVDDKEGSEYGIIVPYPLISRRLNEEGEVTLRFFVNETGITDKIEVLKSSSFKRLDEAAIKAIKERPFKNLTNSTQELTIKFRLN